MKTKQILLFSIIALSLAACKQEKFMEYEGEPYIYFASDSTDMYRSVEVFYDRSNRDSSKSFTFFYETEDVKQNSVEFDLYVAGGPKNYDRPFTIEQVMVEGVENAVSGVHYVAFDSPEMQKECVLKAGLIHMKLPITCMRTNDTKDYVLKFKLIGNQHFTPGEPNYTWRKLLFTSALQRPDIWNDRNSESYFGKYSRVKHEWMIQQTGFRWDADYFSELMSSFDAFGYWMGKLKLSLVEVNRERAAQTPPLGPLEDEDGDVIAFGKYY